LYICKYFSMNTKTKLKEQIDNFSEQFSINELIERLIIIEKIEIGKMQSENNQLISESGLEKGMDTWLM
jgi:ribosomal protein S6